MNAKGVLLVGVWQQLHSHAEAFYRNDREPVNR
jgi:hypothetical protein